MQLGAVTLVLLEEGEERGLSDVPCCGCGSLVDDQSCVY